MSHQAGRAALEIELPRGLKLLLYDLAIRACPACGLTWPGTRILAGSTGLEERALREALAELRRRGLLEVHRYPQGGRGRSTEYVVLPQHTRLSQAPCPECQRVQKPGAPAQGNARKPGGWAQGFGTKPGADPPQNPAPGRPPTGSNQQEDQQEERQAERPATPAAGPPTAAQSSPRPRRNAAELRQEAVRQLDALRAVSGDPKP